MEDPYRFGAHSGRTFRPRVAFAAVGAVAAAAGLVPTILFASGGNTRPAGLLLVWAIGAAPGFVCALVAANKPRQLSVIAGFAVLAVLGLFVAYVVALVIAFAFGTVE
jgi:FtsH-binding integral membrane protein